MLDLVRHEKELLNIRSDIQLPKEIVESLDELGHWIGDDYRIAIDLTLGDNQFKIENTKERKGRGFFSFLRCGSNKRKKDVMSEELQKTVITSRPHIKLLPMSLYPKKVIKKYLGIVDVHVIRLIKLLNSEEAQMQVIEEGRGKALKQRAVP